jgi:hypothetical protein
MCFMQLPSSLPITPPKTEEEPKQETKQESALGGSEQEFVSNLTKIPEGFLGKLIVYKSGKIKMKVGDFIYDVRDLHTLFILLTACRSNQALRVYFCNKLCSYHKSQNNVINLATSPSVTRAYLTCQACCSNTCHSQHYCGNINTSKESTQFFSRS